MKDLNCHSSLSSHQKVAMCREAEERGKPTGPVTVEGSCLLCGFLCDRRAQSSTVLKNIPRAHNRGIVGPKYHLKRVCQKPLRGWRIGGWVLRWGCQISQLRTKRGFKSFAHPDLTKNNIFFVVRLSWDIKKMNLLATVWIKPIKQRAIEDPVSPGRKMQQP